MRMSFMLVACGALSATAAHAQQTSPAALEPGRRAIEFALPQGGGGGVGLWWVRSPRTQLGLTTAFGLQSEDNSAASDRQTQWSLSVGPAIKRHVAVSGPVVPYWRGDAMLGMIGGSGNASKRMTVSASAGFGADWFPVDRVNIGGHMALLTRYTRSTLSSSTGESTREMFELATFRSGLALQVYF